MLGNIIPGSTRPANTTDGSYGFGGSRKRFTEVSLTLAPIRMGARVYLPSLGRFTQKDPVPGGGANDYVYSLDPINSNDYSGRLSVVTARGGLQGGAFGASYLQPAATVTQIQPARTVAYFQPTINGARIQGSTAVATQIRTAPVAQRAAAKPRDNSTALPVLAVAPGLVDAGWLAARTAAANKGMYGGASSSGSGYSNFGLEFTWLIGGTIGVKSDANSHHFYFGPCVGGRGPGGSYSGSLSNLSTGQSLDISRYTPWAIGGSVSNDGSVESGVGSPGFSACVTHTF